MLKSIEAVYDGTSFVPEEAIELAANTRVRLIIETLDQIGDSTSSFLDVAEHLQLDGPSDWSAQLESYLYKASTSDG